MFLALVPRRRTSCSGFGQHPRVPHTGQNQSQRCTLLAGADGPLDLENLNLTTAASRRCCPIADSPETTPKLPVKNRPQIGSSLAPSSRPKANRVDFVEGEIVSPRSPDKMLLVQFLGASAPADCSNE